MNKNTVRTLVLSALFLALGLVLPTAFHAIGAGTVFLPMHIPVLLCGFVCGWQYGAAVGLLTPLISYVITGMPPLFPIGAAMMLELCAYGLLTGLLFKKINVYFSLLAAMLGGRLVSGAANAVLLGMAGKPYGISVFLTSSFVTALPGIVLQLVLIPVLVVALQRAGMIDKARRKMF